MGIGVIAAVTGMVLCESEGLNQQEVVVDCDVRLVDPISRLVLAGAKQI